MSLYLDEGPLELLPAHGVDGEVEGAVDDGAKTTKHVEHPGEGPLLVLQVQALKDECFKGTEARDQACRL